LLNIGIALGLFFPLAALARVVSSSRNPAKGQLEPLLGFAAQGSFRQQGQELRSLVLTVLQDREIGWVVV
jgi:hypothetical protein